MSSLDCKQSSSCSVGTPGTLPASLPSDGSVGQAWNNFKEHLSHTKSIIVSFFSSPQILKEKVYDTCETWGEVWARALMAMWEGCLSVSARPNWAVPDCMEHPRTDRRRLHYLHWSRWCVSNVLHRRLCFFSADSLLCLTPKWRQQRCRYRKTQNTTPDRAPFNQKGWLNDVLFIAWFRKFVKFKASFWVILLLVYYLFITRSAIITHVIN